MCSKYSHPFEFRLTRFTRRLSHLFTFHSQGGLFLRPAFPCVQNSKFTGKVCFYAGFVVVLSLALEATMFLLVHSHSRACARGNREHLARSLILEERSFCDVKWVLFLKWCSFCSCISDMQYVGTVACFERNLEIIYFEFEANSPVLT